MRTLLLTVCEMRRLAHVSGDGTDLRRWGTGEVGAAGVRRLLEHRPQGVGGHRGIGFGGDGACKWVLEADLPLPHSRAPLVL